MLDLERDIAEDDAFSFTHGESVVTGDLSEDQIENIAMSKAEEVKTKPSIDAGCSENDKSPGLSCEKVSQELDHLRIALVNSRGTEEMINYMYTSNIVRLKSNVMKYAIIASAAEKGICGGKLRSGEET